MSAKTIFAIIIAGILGTVATGAVVSAAGVADFAGFVGTVGKHIVAIVIALALPFFFAAMPFGLACLAGFLWCDIVASVVTKLFFGGTEASWTALLSFNGVYALAAVLVYVAITHGHERRYA